MCKLENVFRDNKTNKHEATAKIYIYVVKKVQNWKLNIPKQPR